MRSSYDVVVIGSGPNGLAAAIVAAQRGLSVVVIEGRDEIGGGLKTAELTVPGFRHDVCASVMPMGRVSPFFRSLPLDQHGLDWIVPEVSAAHPLEGGDAVLLHNNVSATAAGLGRDGNAWRLTIGTAANDWPRLEDAIMGPLGVPAHPFRFGRFGIQALAPAQLYANLMFSEPRARGLFAGCAAHSVLPLTRPGSAAIGIALAAVGHHAGWPVARGGAGAVATALASYLRSLGGEIVTGTPIERASDLPDAQAMLFDTSPRALARILGDRLPAGFRSQLERYRYGPGAFKVDWALSEPIPWAAADCRLASTVHVGGTLEEIAAAEAAPWDGRCAERPFVLVTQPSLFDPSRAPGGQHTAWGYCHVPNASPVDMTGRIEAQVERFAPGFQDVILARAIRSPAVMEAENPNLVGGDVGAGSNELLNLFFRPTWRRYATPVPSVFICSGATPPGGGVHGMSGYHAAIRALSGLQDKVD